MPRTDYPNLAFKLRRLAGVSPAEGNETWGARLLAAFARSGSFEKERRSAMEGRTPSSAHSNRAPLRALRREKRMRPNGRRWLASLPYGVTTNFRLLVNVPHEVVTVTKPVVAPVGTMASRKVSE